MKLVLSMIVLDEAASIQKTIASVEGVADHVLVLDTGSKDGTQDLAAKAAEEAKIPFKLVEEPFVDYSTTRNRAVELAEAYGDFVLMLSGDETLEHGKDLRSFIERNLTAPAFVLDCIMGGAEHSTVRISRTGSGWRYHGPAHEVMMGPGEHVPVPKPVRVFHDTSRRTTESVMKRDRKFVEIFKDHLLEDPKNSRSTFYLAQSYEMLNRHQDALKWYERRVKLGGWHVEVYSALYRIARIRHELKEPWDKVLAAYLTAWAAWPARAEPLYQIGQYYRNQEMHDLAYLFLSFASKIPYPEEIGLDKIPCIYYEIQNCLGVVAYYAQQSHKGALGDLISAEGEAAVKRALLENPNDETLNANLAFYSPRSQAELAEEAAVIATEIAKEQAQRRARPGITVAVVTIPGHLHSPAYHEIAESITCGARMLGYEADLVEASEISQDRPAVVFGAHLLPSCPTFKIPPGSVIYNLEQYGTPWFDRDYVSVLKKFPVWDYNSSNVTHLLKAGIKATLVPIGHAPELERKIPPVEKDIDVLFAGALNTRRELVIDDLRKKGLNVVVLQGVYGVERDLCVARSKVVLNVHYYDDIQVLEEARISYMLMNGACVVSEWSANAEDDAVFADAVYFAGYLGLVDLCATAVNEPALREARALAGQRFMRRRPVTAGLRKPLADLLRRG